MCSFVLYIVWALVVGFSPEAEKANRKTMGVLKFYFYFHNRLKDSPLSFLSVIQVYCKNWSDMTGRN